jgi:transposase InsO family protein
VLTTHGITPSMSRKGNCWDNACVERFFGTRKRELVYHRHYATRAEATQDIFEYIEVVYNRKRRHSTRGYHSPAEYEARTAVA